MLFARMKRFLTGKNREISFSPSVSFKPEDRRSSSVPVTKQHNVSASERMSN